MLRHSCIRPGSLTSASKGLAFAGQPPRRSGRHAAQGRRRLVAAGTEREAAGAPRTEETSSEDLACYGIGAEVECVVPEYADGGAPSTASMFGQQAAAKVPALLETLLLISPFFFWGTSMVAMKQLGPHTTPLFLAAWRLLPAGVVLLGWAHLSGRKQPQGGMAWLAVALFALADGTCFQGFLAEGLQRTTAGLGSVIIDSQPLSVAVMASIFFGEKLGAAGVAGLGMGVLGLSLLELQDAPPSLLALLPGSLAAGDAAQTAASAAVAAASSGDLSASGGSVWDKGEFWMLLAAQSMAIGTVMVRWVAKYCDPVAATAWHMILGGIPLAALAAVQEGDVITQRLSQLTPADGGLLLYVSLLGSAASYGVFFYEATVRGNLTALSSLTFLTPMFAAAGGYLLLGETLTPLQLGGAVVTLGAVTLINSGPQDSGKGSNDGGSVH